MAAESKTIDHTVVAEKQLDRVLGFFPRVDAKASFLFAIDTGILTLLAVNLRPADLQTWYIAIPWCVTVLLVAVSLFFAYRCHFPHLAGGERSLIYFREIAGRTEANYISESQAQSVETYLRDLLGQIWRNSEILKIKFDAVKIGFGFAVAALVPWTLYLALNSFLHISATILK